MNNFNLPATAWAITQPGLIKMLSGYKQAQAGLQISLEDFFTARESMQIEQGIANSRQINPTLKLTNIYLNSLGAKPFDVASPDIVGLSEKTKCFVSAEYFTEEDPFAD